jgi:hypothetical protein
MCPKIGLMGIWEVPSGYDSQFAMENPPIFKFGKASISIRAIEKPWQTVRHNQRV